ncbi:MAG: phosphoribosyltransferase [Odoribacter sp.]
MQQSAKNVEHIFELVAPGRIRGRHVLVVDDVITTGATMEACQSLAEADDVKFSLGCRHKLFQFFTFYLLPFI